MITAAAENIQLANQVSTPRTIKQPINLVRICVARLFFQNLNPSEKLPACLEHAVKNFSTYYTRTPRACVRIYTYVRFNRISEYEHDVNY